jgi:hypothetical protein
MMDDARDSGRIRSPRQNVSIAPVAAAGVVAAGAVLAAYLARPERRLDMAAEKRRSLIAYLRDHLSGADVAIHVVRRLASTNGYTRDGDLFRQLLPELEQDRATVGSLLSRMGASSRSIKRTAASVTGLALSLPAGGASGDLSLLRTLEALATGIQGKRCLWRALQELATVSADREAFSELESRALRQWERVEQRRRSLAATTFLRLG